MTTINRQLSIDKVYNEIDEIIDRDVTFRSYLNLLVSVNINRHMNKKYDLDLLTDEEIISEINKYILK